MGGLGGERLSWITSSYVSGLRKCSDSGTYDRLGTEFEAAAGRITEWYNEKNSKSRVGYGLGQKDCREIRKFLLETTRMEVHLGPFGNRLLAAALVLILRQSRGRLRREQC